MEENVIQINGEIIINVNVSVKNLMYVKRIMLRFMPGICENGKYLANIMDNSAIMCDEVTESYNEETNFNEKKANCKMQNFYFFTCIFINY